MSEKESLQGKKINLSLLANEIDTNTAKLELREFMNIIYSVLEDLEENHPLYKKVMKKLGKDYDGFISTMLFLIILRLQQITLSKEDFMEMIDRVSEEETPKELN